MKAKLLILFSFVLLLTPILAFAQTNANQEGYTYYGHVPAKIWFAEPTEYQVVQPKGGWEINPLSIAESALIGVLAYEDDTEVKVYTLPQKVLFKDETISEMEMLFVELPNATFFKVCTNKPVTVEFLGGNVGGEELDPTMNKAPLINSFYPAVDGSYVGKEFIFIAAQGLTGQPYRIVALENSDVTVYKEDGSTLTSFALEANEYKSLSLTAFKAFKVTSTGNIIVQTFDTGRSMYVPSVDGGYAGTDFYTVATTDWDPTVTYGFQIIAAEEAKVTIYDVEFRRKIGEFAVPAGRNITITPKSDEIFIESDNPVSVAFVHHGPSVHAGGIGGGGWAYGAGLTYLGVSPGETVYAYVPLSTCQESFVFAYKDGTVVTIDGAPVVLDADGYMPLALGLHEMKSTENVLIQIVHWPQTPEIQALESFGTIVPAIETLDIRKTVQLQPIPEAETATMTYIYAGVAVAAIAAAAVIYYIKFRK